MNLKLATAVCLLAAILFGAACGGAADSTASGRNARHEHHRLARQRRRRALRDRRRGVRESQRRGRLRSWNRTELPPGTPSIPSTSGFAGGASGVQPAPGTGRGPTGKAGGLLITELNARATPGKARPASPPSNRASSTSQARAPRSVLPAHRRPYVRVGIAQLEP